MTHPRSFSFICSFLSDEQHLAILGQGPEFVIHDEFQLVDVVANLLDERGYGIVVGNSFFADTLYLVGDTAGVYEGFYVLGDEAAVFADTFNEGQIVGADFHGCLLREYFLNLVHIIY